MDKEIVRYRILHYIYSAIKKEESLPFTVTWMDLEGTGLSDICERETQLYELTCIYNLCQKNPQKTHSKRNQICGFQSGLGWGRRNLRKVVKKN